MAETKLIIEVATDHSHLEGKEFCFYQMLAAAGYTSSLMDLLRMARDLDQVQREGDQASFNEGVLAVCQIVKGLQDTIHKNATEICYGAWTTTERRKTEDRRQAKEDI